MTRVGLTLGKFAPLHRGHQLLIESALAEVDHLIVIIYDSPDVTPIPLPIRSAWIRDLYPTVEVIEAWGGPTEVGLSPEITAQHDAYLQQLLAGRAVTHFFSCEPYGEHVSRAFGAQDRRLDRLVVPTSGTEIRANPFANRHLLAPRVYQDLIQKVVFLGAPSTGKSTLCAALAEKYETNWMPEYGREYWEQHQIDRRLTQEQLLEIGVGHIEREDQMVQESNRFLFVDTDATTTYMFALYYFGCAHPELETLAAKAINRYDLFFFCEDDIPYEATWDRSGDVFRTTFHKQTRADLQVRGVPFISISGSLEERVAQVSQFLDVSAPFMSAAEVVRKIGSDIAR